VLRDGDALLRQARARRVVRAAFDLLDRWLTAIEADTSSDPLEVKVVRNKPGDAVDACFINDQKVTDMATCQAAFPHFASPRLVAGMPLSHDIAACQLRPLNRADYAGRHPAAHRRAVGAAAGRVPRGRLRLRPAGCGEEPSIPWMSFKNGPGGQPLGDPPVSTALD
jgi:hypothetical protein